MSVRFLDMEFWEKVYLAAISNGASARYAKITADQAVIHWREGWESRWKRWENDKS